MIKGDMSMKKQYIKPVTESLNVAAEPMMIDAVSPVGTQLKVVYSTNVGRGAVTGQ